MHSFFSNPKIFKTYVRLRRILNIYKIMRRAQMSHCWQRLESIGPDSLDRVISILYKVSGFAPKSTPRIFIQMPKGQ